MKKQTKVLLVAAALTLGASFTSMAAISNGTWQLNEDGWQYVDKEGEYVYSEWCMSYGTEYWVNEDEVLGSSVWVEDEDKEGRWYYAQSDGSKTVNAWKYIYAMDDEDEEGDQNWYYFDAKGRMVRGKKTIGDYTYYFDENGKMLTGWIDISGDYPAEADEDTTVGNVVYANEDGALIKSSWLNLFPWTEDADEMYEGEDEEWYYAGSDGKLYKTKKAIDGLTYFFNAETGIMMEGWIVKDGDVYTSANADLAKGVEAYWTNEIGYASKNKWEFIEDVKENDEFWFHFDKLGRAFIASDCDAMIAEATFEDGEDNTITEGTAVVTESKKINGVEYFFNEKGEMIDGLVYIDGVLHNIVDGAMQTGKATLTDENENDYEFMFAEKTVNDELYVKYAAVTGNYGGYCYNNGQLMTSDEEGVYAMIETANGSFIVDENGKIQKKTGKDYLDNGKTYTFSKVDGATEYSILTVEAE